MRRPQTEASTLVTATCRDTLPCNLIRNDIHVQLRLAFFALARVRLFRSRPLCPPSDVSQSSLCYILWTVFLIPDGRSPSALKLFCFLLVHGRRTQFHYCGVIHSFIRSIRNRWSSNASSFSRRACQTRIGSLAPHVRCCLFFLKCCSGTSLLPQLCLRKCFVLCCFSLDGFVPLKAVTPSLAERRRLVLVRAWSVSFGCFLHITHVTDRRSRRPSFGRTASAATLPMCSFRSSGLPLRQTQNIPSLGYIRMCAVAQQVPL